MREQLLQRDHRAGAEGVEGALGPECSARFMLRVRRDLTQRVVCGCTPGGGKVAKSRPGLELLRCIPGETRHLGPEISVPGRCVGDAREFNVRHLQKHSHRETHKMV